MRARGRPPRSAPAWTTPCRNSNTHTHAHIHRRAHAHTHTHSRPFAHQSYLIPPPLSATATSSAHILLFPFFSALLAESESGESARFGQRLPRGGDASPNQGRHCSGLRRSQTLQTSRTPLATLRIYTPCNTSSCHVLIACWTPFFLTFIFATVISCLHF